MILTSRDMNNLFTKEVEKFTSKGYTYCCNTMAGSQGEIAKVDLLSPDRKQIVRIYMDNGHDKEYNDTIYISTKLYSVKKENIDLNNVSRHSTLWTDHGTEYNRITYYNVERYCSGGKAFTDKEGIEAIRKVQQERISRKTMRWTCNEVTNLTSDKAKKAVLPFVNKQYRCKSYQIRDIERIEKSYNPYQNKTTYSVLAKNHWFELK